jgi:hypothetical protein
MLKEEYCHVFSRSLLHTHTHTHTHTYIYIYIYIYIIFSFSPLFVCLSLFYFFFPSHSFSTPLFVYIFFFRFLPSNEHTGFGQQWFITCIMWHSVLPFNIPKPTQCGRQISSKRFANTVLELLIFMQRKETVSVVMSVYVRPSVRIELCSH